MDNYFGKLQKCDAAWLAIYKVDVEIDISVDYGAGEFRFTIAFSIKKCFMIKKKRHIGSAYKMWNYSMALDCGLYIGRA
jgi:hypothetical protein